MSPSLEKNPDGFLGNRKEDLMEFIIRHVSQGMHHAIFFLSEKIPVNNGERVTGKVEQVSKERLGCFWPRMISFLIRQSFPILFNG